MSIFNKSSSQKDAKEIQTGKVSISEVGDKGDFLVTYDVD